MKQIGVGILGFGTVGAGVADGLLKHREVMAKRLGVDEREYMHQMFRKMMEEAKARGIDPSKL